MNATKEAEAAEAARHMAKARQVLAEERSRAGAELSATLCQDHQRLMAGTDPT